MKKIAACFVIYSLFSFQVFAVNFGELPAVPSPATTICTEKRSPGTIVQGTPGLLQWFDVDSSAAEDAREASFDSHSNKHIKDAGVRLMLADGSIGSADKSRGSDWTELSQYVSYGGDAWGANLTASEINDPNFGFAFQAGGGAVNSYYLKTSNFGFQIPATSSVTGVTVEMKRREALRSGTGGEIWIGYIDHIRMSVCYTLSGKVKKGSFPLILEIVGDVKDIRVAPGEALTIPVTFQTAAVERISDVAILYQIKSQNGEKMEETDSITISSAAEPYKTIQIPKDFPPGIYGVTGTFLSEGEAVWDVISFPFTVEHKIAGIFVSRFVSVAGILLLLGIIVTAVSFGIAFARKKAVRHDYADVPEPQRVYYEIISDMIGQIHDSIGEKAYKMAGTVAGLSIDKTTGKILAVTKDPSEVVSVLYIRYQNVFKKQLNITGRSKNTKGADNASAAKKHVDEFEKYFRKK